MRSEGEDERQLAFLGDRHGAERGRAGDAADHGYDMRVGDEALRDIGRILRAGAIVADGDFNRPSPGPAGCVDLLDGEIDAIDEIFAIVRGGPLIGAMMPISRSSARAGPAATRQAKTDDSARPLLFIRLS